MVGFGTDYCTDTADCGHTTPPLSPGLDAFVRHFASGAKSPDAFRLGFELEQLITTARGEYVPYGGGVGIEALLQRLRPRYRETITNDGTADGRVIGLIRADAIITLEPGAQFEYSPPPFTSVDEMRLHLTHFNAEVNEVLRGTGYLRRQLGYQPLARVDDIELLPKERYRLMDAHFQTSGRYGRNMMRGTASTQVIVDYSDPADAIRKLRAACALTPLLGLLTDNSPWFEGGDAPGRMMRTRIWADLDPDRCGLVPGVFDAGFGFADYARAVLTHPLVVYMADGVAHDARGRTAAELYDLDGLSGTDIDHILSMFFYDVRLRKYVEIRPADSLPMPYALAYVALIKGLFYDAENLERLDGLCAGWNDDTVPEIKAALIADGYDTPIAHWYPGVGRTAADALAELLGCARRALAADEAAYLDVFDALVRTRTTPAQIAHRRGVVLPLLDQ
ncbi:MAG: glutamate--cysteine ligase [Actinomycetes bacterium]|nr:glutamate--cysteine ligase [Actinomycetes bacterium]